MQALRVAVIGASGRMGRFACELVSRTPGFELVATAGRGDDWRGKLELSSAKVALDVTRAGMGYEHGRILLECGLRPLIGTSGVTLEENRALDAQARELGLGGLVVPNFSLGMWLLQRAAVEAARHFSEAEIIEMHHERKTDAPSGTALDTRERMQSVREKPSPKPIDIHSVRLPGLYAHQLVMLGGPGEVYTLRHDMSGPEAFGSGILRGLVYASRAAGIGRGIELAFADE